MKELTPQFQYISQLITTAQQSAYQSVNQTLIELYWNIGKYLSQKVAEAAWGSQTVQQLSDYIKQQHPNTKGFSRRTLFRMKQFYETYRTNEKVSTLLTQISWSSHLDILAKTKTNEEKEFYIRLAIKERLTVRQLRRHLNTAYFERVMLADKKLPPAIQQLPQEVAGQFKDTYVFEFLELPK